MVRAILNSYSLFLTVLELRDTRLSLQITNLKLPIGNIPEQIWCCGGQVALCRFIEALYQYLLERKAVQQAPERLTVGSCRVCLGKDCSANQGISC